MSIKAEVRKVILEMDYERFLSFQRELQYANRMHQIRNEVAWNAMKFNEGDLGKESAHGSAHHSHMADRIKNSTLYAAAREVMSVLYKRQFAPGETGWMWLYNGEDKEFDAAIKVLARKEFPIYGVIGAGVTDEESKVAQKRFEAAGFKGTFYECDDLDHAFLGRYLLGIEEQVHQTAV